MRNVLYLLCTLFGIGLVAHELLSVRQTTTVAAVAYVNKVAIPVTRLHSLANSMDGMQIDALSEGRKRDLIELLIDEELLFQRAQQLGLLDEDTSVRKALIQAAVDDILVASQSRRIATEELEDYFNSHLDTFIRAERMQLEALRFDYQAEAEYARQTFPQWAELQANVSIASHINVGSAPLPYSQLRLYLGESLVSTAKQLPIGEISQPIAHSTGFYLLYVVQRTATQTPSFLQVRAMVEQEYLRRQRENALANKLGELHQQASVVMQPAVDVVAKVNGIPIQQVDYLRALQALATDRLHALTIADEELVLQRMIEEELLLWYAQLQQLASQRPKVRQLVLNAMLEHVMADLESQLPGAEASTELWLTRQRDRVLKTYIADLRSGAIIDVVEQTNRAEPQHE